MDPVFPAGKSCDSFMDVGIDCAKLGRRVSLSESGRELARLQETSGLGPDQAIVVACSSTPARDPQMACFGYSVSQLPPSIRT